MSLRSDALAGCFLRSCVNAMKAGVTFVRESMIETENLRQLSVSDKRDMMDARNLKPELSKVFNWAASTLRWTRYSRWRETLFPDRLPGLEVLRMFLSHVAL